VCHRRILPSNPYILQIEADSLFIFAAFLGFGSMPDTPQIAVSPNNPCPFLRALVAYGYVGGHIVPLSQLCQIIEAASGKQGAEKKKAGREAYVIAVSPMASHTCRSAHGQRT
jgi:hypothetical protein